MRYSSFQYVLCLSLLLVGVFVSPVYANDASGLTVRPFLIDETLEPRDIRYHEISLQNNTGRLLTLYATVNEITVDTEGAISEYIEPSMSDRTNTITSWLDITRGRISLQPGEATTTSLKIHVNPLAQAGEYHAFIGFYHTNKRHLAEEAAMRGEVEGIPVKVAVAENKNVALTLEQFGVSRFIISESDSKIRLLLENKGETPVVPTGEVIFYDNTGSEIASVGANPNTIAIDPDSEAELAVDIPFYGGVGRYKANVQLQYGPENSTIFDTTQFFIVPWHLLLIGALGILLFSLLVTYLLKRAFDDEEPEFRDEISIPLRVSAGKTRQEKDHDITLTK